MHKMVLIGEREGMEEWLCPSCGRRMTITWQPWKRNILEPGDVYAGHTASKGGLRVEPLQITPGNAENTSTSAKPINEDPYLAPWLRWLDKIDSDDLWNKDL